MCYGKIFIVTGTLEQSGETYVLVNNDESDLRGVDDRKLINSADVEIYGEPVSPADLRFRI